MLRERYYEVISHLKLDLDHLEEQMKFEDEPRELAHLRSLALEMRGKIYAYEMALKSMTA